MGEPKQPPSAVRARILVIDDEAQVRRALERSLSTYHDVATAGGGAEALARIAEGERFDAILSDLMMPEVSGKELYERLESLAPDQAERMIFLTGGAFTEAAREFLDRVPNPRVEKPIELPELLAVIAACRRPGG